MGFLKEKGMKFLDLEKQYRGRRLVDLIVYSQRKTRDKNGCMATSLQLKNELVELGVFDDAECFIKKEVMPNLLNKTYWKQDAGNFVYSFYDYFFLGYGDLGKLPMEDETIFGIMNYTIYYIVSIKYINSDIDNFLSKIHKPFIFF